MSNIKSNGKARGNDARRNRLPPKGHPSSQRKSINALKTKIRNTERLLKHADDLPADVRVEKERALAGYRRAVEDVAEEKARSKMISKYHKVRFVERQKAARVLKKLTRMHNSDLNQEISPELLEKAITNAQCDLNYTMYHPLMEKYQSLYAGEKDNQSPEQTSSVSIDVRKIAECAAKRPPMWVIVQKCTQEGTLESLRAGKLKSSHTHEHQTQKKEAAAGKATHVGRSGKLQAVGSKKKDADIHDEDSDGGFFE